MSPPLPYRLVNQLGRTLFLDKVADPIADLVRKLTDHQLVKNALSGAWLGHRLHPLLTDVAIGSYLGAALADLVVPGQAGQLAAKRLLAAGLVATVPTAAAGLSDWTDVYGDARRIGLVHAAGNVAASGMFLASLVQRSRGRLACGRALSWAGLGVMTGAGYLGGHLSYVLGVGVDHTGFQPRLEDWVDVVAGADVSDDGDPVVASAGDFEVLLLRRGGRLHALARRCSHAGWGMEGGEVADGCITCPYHASTFALHDGQVRRGPAATAQPVYRTREVDGRIEVRS